MPIAPPKYRICLLHDQSMITSRLCLTLDGAINNRAIEGHIMRKAKWEFFGLCQRVFQSFSSDNA
jgi:hypothetical protein